MSGVAARASRPYLGLAGVLLGAMISTLAGRITTFGLADVRGGIGAGVDEGAWITTASTVGQMVIAFPAVWLGAVFGPRRVLLWAAGSFCVAQGLLPLSAGLGGVLGLQAIAGLASGAFIPLTISFVLRNLPASLAAYGIAIYGMNSELSQNIAASAEGWFVDHLSWRWIFWDTAVLAPLMMLCIWLGVPREPVRRDLLERADISGMLFAAAGFGMLYAALDQGNRLDWLNSGIVCGLLLGGTLLVTAFIVHEALSSRRSIDLRFLTRGNIPLLGVMLVALRLVILSTAYLIPQYLTTIQGYRALDTGYVLLWIALPQLLLAPIVGLVLSRVDARLPLAVGFALVGAACFMATGLTQDWATDDFLPSQVLQAVGQSFALSSLVFFATRHISPAEALTFGAFLQTARLFGGELGTAAMQTLVRVREQLHSFLLGLHVTSDAPHARERLAGGARAMSAVAHAVQTQANVLAYIDGFRLLAAAVLACLLLMLLLRAAPAAVSASRTPRPGSAPSAPDTARP